MHTFEEALKKHLIHLTETAMSVICNYYLLLIMYYLLSIFTPHDIYWQFTFVDPEHKVNSFNKRLTVIRSLPFLSRYGSERASPCKHLLMVRANRQCVVLLFFKIVNVLIVKLNFALNYYFVKDFV